MLKAKPKKTIAVLLSIKGDMMQLTNQMKKDIKAMFNQYLTEYMKVMAYDEAVIFAKHKTSQNAMIMLKTYSE